VPFPKIETPLTSVVLPALMFGGIFFIGGLFLSNHSVVFVLVVSVAAGAIYGVLLFAGHLYRASHQSNPTSSGNQ